MSNVCIKSERSVIATTVYWNRFFSNFLLRVIFFLIWSTGLFSTGLLFGSFFLENTFSNQVLGFSLVSVALFMIYLSLRAFNYDKLRVPEMINLSEAKQLVQKGSFNFYSIFSYELAKATYDIFHKDTPLTTREVGLAILSSDDINFILARFGLSQSEVSHTLNLCRGQVEAVEVFKRALDIAIAESHHQIEIGDVFIALCELDNYFKKVMMELKIDIQDVANVVYWQTMLVREYKKEHRLLNADRLKLTGGIGRDWAFGYAINLNRYAVDISAQIRHQAGLGMDIIGHRKEMREIVETLSKQKGGNVIVVGEQGVGKRTAILGFVDMIMKGETKTALDFMHVFELNPEVMLKDAKSPQDMIAIITDVFNESIAAGNIIIFIENIQKLFSSDKLGEIDATEILNSILDYPGVHVIGTSDLKNFDQYIEQNATIGSKFTKVLVKEPSEKEMVRILEDTIPMIEYETKSIISYEAIKETIKAANRYIPNSYNPEKSITLLESAAHKATSEKGATIVLPKDISAYIVEKYEVPAGDADNSEKTKLLNLELIMHKSVIGQEEALKAIANAMRRSRAGIENDKKPIGSFLFLGPTGVGKTQTAKTLAQAYFGSKSKMLRFDMSEYKSTDDIKRLIGGGGNAGTLTLPILEHPFCLILFDEIEKANKEILDLFLQMLDEGVITDGDGRKVFFSSCIIIATSNAGANIIRESINNGVEYEKTKAALLEYIQKENIFKPEFLNRFTSVVSFSPLSSSEIVEVTKYMVGDLVARIKANKGIDLVVTDDAIVMLSKMGYDPVMGARSMDRLIQEKIENALAVKVLSDELKSGDTITITAMNLE